jgi:hypothetical protein
MKPDQKPGQPPVPGPPPNCALLVMCVECGRGLEVPLPTDRDKLALLLSQHSWFVSILSPPGQGPEVPVLMGALCGTCAPNVLPPPVLKAAEEHRKKLLQETR